MDDLVTWLRAQLDEDERAAKAATAGPWWDSPVLAASGHHTIRGGPGEWRGFDGSLGGDALPVARIEPAPDDEGGFCTNHDADAKHIARHNPARVLREVEAKRRILDEWMDADARRRYYERDGEEPFASETRAYADALEKVYRLMALPYADRPGYRDEWKP